jgi:hypothetical protein
VTVIQVASIKTDLLQLVSSRTALFCTDFAAVVEDVAVLTGGIIRDGIAKALARLPDFAPGLLDRPFIEVADVIVNHHVRLIPGPECEVVRKSLLEAYIHAAGPNSVFGPPGKTRLVRSLRQYGERNFAGLIFSLYLFNVISIAIQDKVRQEVPDARSFELYMLGVESVCREAVESAVHKIGSVANREWATAVAKHIERQLLQGPSQDRGSRGVPSLRTEETGFE